MFRKLIDNIPTLLCSGITIIAILWLTLAPRPVGEVDLPLFPYTDKLVHAIMFGFLTLTLYIDTGKIMKRQPGVIATASCSIVATLFGTGIEFIQQGMNMGRSMETSDILADGIGAFTTSTIILILNKKH